MNDVTLLVDQELLKVPLGTTAHNLFSKQSEADKQDGALAHLDPRQTKQPSLLLFQPLGNHLRETILVTIYCNTKTIRTHGSNT